VHVIQEEALALLGFDQAEIDSIEKIHALATAHAPVK
jgi:hypothetical protein